MQFVKALRALSITRGTIVGIEAEDRFLHWLLILACECIGAPSISFYRRQLLRSDDDLVGRCDLILTNSTQEKLGGPRIHVLTKSFIDSVGNTKVTSKDMASLNIAVDLEKIVRIATSSGTTGRPKTFAITNRVHQARVNNHILMNARHIARPRHVSFYNFWIRAPHTSMTATLQMGGTIILTNFDKFLPAIEKHRGNFSLVVAGDFERIVNHIPDSFRRPDVFKFDVRGGAFSSALRSRAMEKIASQINLVYALNEVGCITSTENDGMASILPNVEVKIVDEGGAEKKRGEAGIIWVKSDTMISGYLEGASQNSSSFNNGWFNTNDIGRMPAPGHLVVLGRSDDMLNIGGSKIAPGAMEEHLKRFAGVRDAAVVCIENENGIGQPAVAIEAAADVDERPIRDFATRFFRRYTHTIHFKSFQSFPRTDNGKIKRREIEAMFQLALKRNEK
jgi:acyl-CoA synthetase (AMP-forming)/AMP-acid ligase II